MEENKINENITDTNAIVGMILGILSVILCWVPVIGLVLGIVALILSIKGLKYTIVYIIIFIFATTAVDEIKKYDTEINNYYNETKSYYRNHNYEYNSTILDDYDI